MFGSVRFGSATCDYSAELRICGVLRSPLALAKVNNTKLVSYQLTCSTLQIISSQMDHTDSPKWI